MASKLDLITATSKLLGTNLLSGTKNDFSWLANKSPITATKTSGTASGLLTGGGGGGSEDDPPDDTNYGSGYGSSGSGYSQTQKDNLLKVSAGNAKAAQDQYNQQIKEYENADKQNLDFLNTENKQYTSKSASEWYNQQKDLQSTVNYLGEAQRNMRNGSGYLDFNDILRRQDDIIDVDALESLKQNKLNAQNEYSQTAASIQNSKNSAMIDYIKAIKDNIADLAAQENTYDEDAASTKFNDDGTINTSDEELVKYYGSDILDMLNKDPIGTYDFVFKNNYAREENARRDADLLNSTNRSLNGATNTIYQNSLRGYDRRNQNGD